MFPLMNDLIAQTQQDLSRRLKDGRDRILEDTGLRGVFDGNALDEKDAADVAVNPDAIMDGGVALKNGGATRVAGVRLGEDDYVIKRYNWRGWAKGLRYMIKGSRARRVWFYAHLLGRIGVYTQRPVLWLERSRSGIVRFSYIMTRHVEGLSLFDYLLDSDRSDSERRAILDEAAGVLQKLSSHRITHGDMKRSNVLVSDGRICLIDLDAAVLNRTGIMHRIRERRDVRIFFDRMLGQDMPDEIRRMVQQCGMASGR